MASHVIVLNENYSFLSLIHWRRAVSLIIKGKCEVVKHSDKEVYTAAATSIKIPAIIRLLKVVRIIFKREVPYGKKNVFTRDKYICQYCGKQLYNKGKKEDKPTLDHIVPVSKGGQSTWLNTVTSCFDCNHKKSNKSLKEAGMFLKTQPYQPTINEFIQIKMKLLGIEDTLKDLYTSYI